MRKTFDIAANAVGNEECLTTLTRRLIQGGVIDLAKHLLSCNDPSSIKIVE